MVTLAAKMNTKIRYKNESPLMKIIGVLLFFNPKFMTRYTTTLTFFGRSTVYFPDRSYALQYSKFWRTLAHELVHASDATRSPILFNLGYLFPQILAIFSLLSILAWINLSWLWCLLFLVFLAPIPSPGRKWAEMRGYAVSMVIEAEIGGAILSPERFVGRFTTADYYYMWPFKKSVMSELLGWKALYESDRMKECIPVFSKIQDVIRRTS